MAKFRIYVDATGPNPFVNYSAKFRKFLRHPLTVSDIEDVINNYECSSVFDDNANTDYHISFSSHVYREYTYFQLRDAGIESLFNTTANLVVRIPYKYLVTQGVSRTVISTGIRYKAVDVMLFEFAKSLGEPYKPT